MWLKLRVEERRDFTQRKTIRTEKKRETERMWLKLRVEDNTKIRLIIFFAAKFGEALYNQQKQDQELTVAQIMCLENPRDGGAW